MADFNRLEYTLATFRETLRLLPTLPRLQRTALVDAVVPCHKLDMDTGNWEPSFATIRRGMGVLVNIGAAHRNPVYWGVDAHIFRPERFIDDPDTGYEWPRHAWLPFIAGPRVCIGQRFAMLETVCIIARVLRRYRVSPTLAVSALSKEKQMETLTKWVPGMTALPNKFELVFERRDE